MTIESGHPAPLGATYDGGGTNFALFSANAEAVELCLYDATGTHETARYDLPEQTNDVWHGFVAGVEPGACYGYRVHGAYDPEAGHRFNPHKLLLDPYARKLQGSYRSADSNYGFNQQDELEDLSFDTRDNADNMPKAVVTVVVSELKPLRHAHRTPWHETVIYETHVRGFTQKHPALSSRDRGKFSGLGQPQVIEYLKSLGATSVELLPVQSFINEPFLKNKGLSNYWGYNTLSFFTPHAGYMSGTDTLEFRHMVDQFHDAGLEVILDVVYNHTCEGNQLGPTLSFRGIDNASYYQLLPSDKRFYINDSGCGNTLNIHHPRVMQMVIDSLRYWVEIMGVDGFRFDLASVLGRDEHGFNQRSAFFQIIGQDPLLSTCKLIAEPWDLGPGGYQLGGYPQGWSEWNDRYRDTVRRFWRGDQGELPELARRLHGSGDIFEHSGRRPYAGINFITSHDGFTLRDLVSYKKRHNEANLENNRDGHNGNLSHNHGVEGPTDDPDIDALRWRQQRNFLATLAVSQGVPMLLAGDEMGRTQQGNNNAYCQDNEINWLDWDNLGQENEQLQAFTRAMLSLRKSFPVLQADRYRHQPNDPSDDSIQWVNPDGEPMLQQHWHERDGYVLGYLLSERDDDNQAQQQLLVVFNASDTQQSFNLPQSPSREWWRILDTADSQIAAPELNQLSTITLIGKSLKIYSSEIRPGR